MTILPRAARRFLAACLLAAILYPAGGSAEPCHQYFPGGIPDCEAQVQAPVSYDAWQTSGWAYYCTGDHPYSWGLISGFPGNFTWDNSCFSAAENLFAEQQANKFDATFTNWCLSTQSIAVTLGCSRQPPPGFAPGCNFSGPPLNDPGCATSNVTNHCSNTNPVVCFQTSNETCGDASRYTCTTDLAVTLCYRCE